MADLSTYPLLLPRISEFAEHIYDSQYKSFHDKHLPTIPWLSYTLLTYLQKYFQTCTHVACKPSNIRAIMSGSTIYPKLFKDAELSFPNFMEQLGCCVIRDNMGSLASPPASFSPFPLQLPSPKGKQKICTLKKTKIIKTGVRINPLLLYPTNPIIEAF